MLVWDYSPGAATGGKQHTRHLSLRGWLPSDARTLDGPVAHVFSDTNDNNKADAGEEITPASDGTFSFPFKPFTGDHCGPAPCSWDQKKPYSWQTNREQNAAQVMYFLGKFHDHLQAAPIGFTRAAGNFDGRDGDAVQAQTDDGAAMNAGLPDEAHINNANMGTPPDGQAPTMQIYLTGVYPDYPDLRAPSGNFGDVAPIVYHEYTHGLSNRLVVDANGVSTLRSMQSWSMGEAWSDWYAADFLADEGYFRDNPRVDGEVSMDPPGWRSDLPLRTQPLDCPVGSASATCPGSKDAGAGGYTYGDYGKVTDGPETHADGEIWGETLWDLRTVLGSKLTESLVTRAMELSPANPTFLDERNAILQADTVVNGGRANDVIWKVFAHRGMGYFAAAFSADDTKPDEDFSLPPGPHTPRFTLTGKVIDDDASGAPAGGVTVSISGHSSGYPGSDFSAVTAADGTYTIAGVPEGTYRKVYASGGGYEPQIRTVDLRSDATADWTVRRNWAASLSGAKVADFSGADYSDSGCGPDDLIDMSAAVWGSDARDGTNGTGVDPVHNTVELPRAVDIRELLVDPTAGCGDDLSASLGDYRIETSTDGTTWTTAAEGHFTPADTGRQNSVQLKNGTGDNIQYVRLTMLGNQVADNGRDCAKDSGPAGCRYMDVTELVVHGTAHQP
ncbi:M36 family metallopeptidase [Streptomyces sp. NPDC091217]|uniref:M36 family metallopeptidase n=1 Tax=Streptomyces sp. NPDC091217 TaxID=3365975 RepID=UPI0038206ECE